MSMHQKQMFHIFETFYKMLNTKNPFFVTNAHSRTPPFLRTSQVLAKCFGNTRVSVSINAALSIFLLRK